jgi:hypothetical protein
VFDVMGAGATTLARLDGGETLGAICEAALEVDAWWAYSAPTTPVTFLVVPDRGSFWSLGPV